jgi:hypothetical protein
LGDTDGGDVSDAFVELSGDDLTCCGGVRERFAGDDSTCGRENGFTEAHGNSADHDAVGIEEINKDSECFAGLFAGVLQDFPGNGVSGSGGLRDCTGGDGSIRI